MHKYPPYALITNQLNREFIFAYMISKLPFSPLVSFSLVQNHFCIFKNLSLESLEVEICF